MNLEQKLADALSHNTGLQHHIERIAEELESERLKTIKVSQALWDHIGKLHADLRDAHRTIRALVKVPEVCETCNGTGRVECWSPGGPCPNEAATECQMCGQCRQCAPLKDGE